MPDTWVHKILVEPPSETYWQNTSHYSDTTIEVQSSPVTLPFSEVQLVFTRTTPAGIVDDVMTTHLAFSKRVLLGSMSMLNTSDKSAIETALGTFWTAIKPTIPAQITLKEYRWHDYLGAGSKPGPATRVTTVNVAATGTGATAVPDQVAETVTFRTASRKHWGRIYLPKFTIGNFDAYGRLATTAVDTVAAAVRALLNTAEAATTPVFVVSHLHGGMLSISELAMDNTADVVRRRRAKHPNYFKVYTS